MIWPTLDARADVDMLWRDAPTLCGLLWDALPFQSVQEHALITGCMLFASTRISTLVRENTTTFIDMAPGACYFATGSQNVGLVYGHVTEPEGQSVWGRVREADWPTLDRVGRAVWANTMAADCDIGINPFAKRIIPVAFEPR
ncbi:hypothetical protein SAMN05519103_08630 [Rhizobiales bacterium GAS113]|nr:hypothetical protein SAMN05519103_08630 [Rhizobiales bacterium GAS113]